MAEAQATGFRPEILEKVIHLLGLLDGLRSHPMLKGKLALKGGTALNLFVFELPRLSVDIDLNYLGSTELEAMQGERKAIEDAVQAVCAREGFSIRRMPSDHAGGKWALRYESAFGQGGNLEIDFNFMFRVPLWPAREAKSFAIGSYGVKSIPVLDIHELAGGKLAALLARRKARDLFDAHRLLYSNKLDHGLLRIAFVVYGAMNRKDWRKVSLDDVGLDVREMNRQLIPLLRLSDAETFEEPSRYGERLVTETREALSAVLPMNEGEMRFLDLLLDQGKIGADCLEVDQQLSQRIASHPLLLWKAHNVRLHKGM